VRDTLARYTRTDEDIYQTTLEEVEHRTHQLAIANES